MKKQEIVVLSVVCGFALIIVVAGGLLFWKQSSRQTQNIPALSEKSQPIANEPPTTPIESPVSNASPAKPLNVEPKEESLTSPLEMVETNARTETEVEKERSRDLLRVKDWSSWDNSQKSAYCERVAENLDDLPYLELLWEMEVALRDFENFDQPLSEIVGVISIIAPRNPLAGFTGNGKTQTKTFAVGKRRFVPIVWTADKDGFFSFSLYNALDGRIVEANVVMSNDGHRNLWIDPGAYYLDVNATGEWGVKFFRSTEQLEKMIAEAKKRDQQK